MSGGENGGYPTDDQVTTELQRLSAPCPCDHPRCTGRAFHMIVDVESSRPSWASEYPALFWRGIDIAARFADVDPWLVVFGRRSASSDDARFICWWALDHMGFNRIQIGEHFGRHRHTIGKGIGRGANLLGAADAAKLATLLR